MPRRRPPRVFPERVTSAIESMIPGTLGGRVSSASPVVSTDHAATIGGNAGVVDLASGDSFYWDRFEITSDGAQDLTLTYLPLDGSEHVYLNGPQQGEGVDWAREGQRLSVLTAMDVRTDDILEVRYAHRFGAPVTPVDLDLDGYPAEVIADAPLLYYRLGETVGLTAADDSGNNRDGVYVNAPTLGAASCLPNDTDPSIETGLSGDKHVETPHVSAFNTSALTFEFWSDMGGSGGRDVFVHPGRTRLRVGGGSGIFELWVAGAWSIIGSTDTSWTSSPARHLAVSYDGTSLKFWQDGVQYGSTVAAATALPSGSGTLVIGSGVGNSGLGRLDEVALYGAALSSTRIAAHYAAA